MISAEYPHQAVLWRIDILELINHNVLQPLLPFTADLLVLFKNIQRKVNQIIIIQPEALLLLVQIAVEYNILCLNRFLILAVQTIQGHGNQIPVIFRLRHLLADLDPVSGIAESHMAQRQAALLIDNLQHGVDIRVIQHLKVFRIGNGITVLLQNGYTETMKSTDISGVVIPRQPVNPLTHLIRRLIRKSYTQDIPRQNADCFHQIGKSCRQRPRLAGTGSGDHADISFRCC